MSDSRNDIAVVGMSCRFPGAWDVDEYWNNLCLSVESISFFQPDQLIAEGIAAEKIREASYVPARGVIPEPWAFDARFFGISPNEALVIDPQQRIFLECAYTALEDAACDPRRFVGAIGVFGGCGTTDYYSRVLAHTDYISAVGHNFAAFGSLRDFLTTRVSYKLGLRGPSVGIQTGCSTSLVAIHVACQSLLNHECDLALAGGASIACDQISGYHYEEGGIRSPDGHCRAFDARAAGTVSGSGVGIVALRRLKDALHDGDPIRAIVRASAINNDGMEKIGFTAPSVTGQAQVIAEALALAGVDPATVGYIEAHGTGTHLGDPIEIAALTQVFGGAQRKKSCALGAVKTNIGHLDTASGVAGFIKAVLVLQHRTLPPTLHFEKANPETGLDESPFFVNTVRREWQRNGTPLRAGVSSFGMGGTNAHAVLEEAPERVSKPTDDTPQVLILSAKSESAINAVCRNLEAYLAAHPSIRVSDVAFTLQEGRIAHPHRWAAVVRDIGEARQALAGRGRSATAKGATEVARPVAFLFPGQGTQRAGTGQELYDFNPVFRREIDHCAEALAGDLKMDLRSIIFPAPDKKAESERLLRQTLFTQPALFSLEFALAKMWMSWGVEPEAMLGHSIGEYTAACLAGVFSLEDALRLVAARASLIQSLPTGAMLAVRLSEEEVSSLLPEGVFIAATNSGESCVVSGAVSAIAEMRALLEERGTVARELETSHAFHSPAMDPILGVFAQEVRKTRPKRPRIRFLSNVTGDWIRDAEAMDPSYWARHLRATVRFGDGMKRLRESTDRVMVEVGIGHTLSAFARRGSRGDESLVAVQSLNPQEDGETLTILKAVGTLWTAGININWAALRGTVEPRRLALPTYPFERQQYRVPRAPRVSSVSPERTSETSPTAPISAPTAASMAPAMALNSNHNRSRLSSIAARIEAVFARLLGTEAKDTDHARSFLEMGADSLLLMQASRSFETEFGVRIPFRRLIEGLNTIGALAEHLDRESPRTESASPEPQALPSVADKVPSRQAELVPPKSASPASGETSPGLQAIVAQQLAIMQAQLEMLRDGQARHTAERLPDVFESSKREERENPAKPAESQSPVSHGPHHPVSQTIAVTKRFNEQQLRYFQDFERRFTARTRRSKQYAAENRLRLADNRAVLGFRTTTKELVYPIVGEHSEGSRLWDVDGNEYVDFTCGFGVHFFGHRPFFITEAVQQQLKRGFHLGPQSDLAGPAAELFCELTGMERVAFSNTGSEAIMTAVRLARAVTGRDRIVVFEGAYHGCFDGVLARSAGMRDGEPYSLPVGPGTPAAMIKDVVVLPYGTDGALQWLQAHAGSLAAVLVEPIQTGNLELRPSEFLKQIRSLTQREGTVLIFDEMVMGLRLGLKGAQGYFGITADLATYGKVLGGGFPIGAIAGSARYMDFLDGGQWRFGDDSFPASQQVFFAGTFCKHPVTMAAACAVLRHIENEGAGLYDQLNERSARLVSALREVIEEEQVPIRISACGSVFRIRADSREPFSDLLFHHLLERGTYIWEKRSCFLSTAHSDEDCDRLTRAFRDGIGDLRSGGFLPEKPVSRKETPSVSLGRRSFPLTPAQRQIWIHSQLGDDASRAYNEEVTRLLPGPLDLDVIRGALEDVVSRHEMLRTVFDSSGENQHVLDSMPIVLRLDAPDDQITESDPLPALDAKKEVFDLQAGPLFHVRVRPSDAEGFLVRVVFHHIIMDALGVGVFLRDLKIACRARRDGLPVEFPQTMQFSQYATLLRSRIDAHAGQAAQWLAGFDGATPLMLPTDHPRFLFPTAAAARVSLVLQAPLVASLKSSGAVQRRTLLMTLLGGVLATLHRLSNQEDIVIGIPAAGRSIPGSESLVGHCVDVLPIRSQVGDTTRLPKFLNDIRGWVLDALDHETFSLGQLTEKLQFPRGPAVPALVSVVVNLEPSQTSEVVRQKLGRTGRSDASAGSGSTKFDIAIDVFEQGDTIKLACQFKRDLFEEGTIERMLGYLERVLEQIAANADVRLSELELMNSAERQQIVEQWNQMQADYTPHRCIHELFQEQVEKAPDAVAVVDGETALSYGELNRRANQLTHYLRGVGVKPDERVAICLERSAQMIVSLLAVLKAGGAYVALDPAYPEERLRYMVEDSAPVALLTESGLEGLFAGLTRAIAVVDVTDTAAISGQSEANPESAGLTSEHLAYVIYTSGSTGIPKGVLVSHDNVARLFSATDAWFHFDATDVWTCFHSFAFDFSVWEIWGALLYGGRLSIVSESMARSPEDFYRMVCRTGITVLNQTPSAFRQLISAQGQIANEHRLRHVIFGGEALEVSSLKPWFERNGNAPTRLVNMYGITETTVHVTYRAIKCSDVSGRGGSSIGRRIPDLSAYILDVERRPVPVGVSGELYIGGAGVSRGYLNRPRLTAERFEPDPFGGAGGRLYRTGDLGRWQEDGNIEFLGRNDFQVKIRGFRIELGEIEARLSEQEGVREAVVLAREDTPGDKRLVAYYTASDAGTGAEQLRAHLSGKLPEYMVPAAYVRLESLPLTRNGKLDRKALPAPEADAFAVPGYAAPQTETEQVLAGIFAELLKRERVGRQDNFFELGGHSLLVVMLIERMRRGGLQADVRAVFERPTVAGLAASLTRQEGAIEIPANGIPAGCSRLRPAMLPLVQLTQEEIDRLVSSVPGGAGNVQDIYPLSPLQEGILFHHMMGGEGDPYLLAIRMRFAERTRLDAYLGALQGVINRHDMLRTAVQWEGVSEPVQVVWRKATLVLEEVKPEAGVEDVSGWLAERYDPRRVRIDLGQAPMLRAYIAQDGQTGGWLMTLLQHHLTDDNTTLNILQEEIEAHLLGQAERLPEPLPFRNLVGQARLGMSREEHEAFFRKLLGDVEEPTAPFGLMNVHGDGTGIEKARMRVDAEVARRIRERARVLGVSAATVCHLAWAQVIGRVAGREDVVFGTVVFGRMQGGAGSDRAMGMLINTLPMRVRLAGYTAEAAAKQVHAQLGELLQHEHCPLSLAQRCSGVAAPMPLFSALLNYRHSPDMAQSRSEDSKRLWEGISVLHAEERTNYPLTLSVDDRGTGFGLTAQVDESIGARRVCELMHRALESLTEALEKEPGRLLEQLDVLPEAERRQVLYEWNDTAAEYPRGRCIQELFEEQVEKTPEAVAVVHAEAAVSYGELNRCANRLAHHLRNLGVKLEDRVAICLERSPEMIVSLLAVLKAGAAYVPLDPAYPEERLRYMLQDSRPVAVLTQPHLQGRLGELSPDILVAHLNCDELVWSKQPETNPEPNSGSLNLAYTIYTSGSTGAPKGVMNAHGPVCNLLAWMQHAHPLNGRSVVLQKTPFSFDASVWEILWPLLNGARLVMTRPDGHQDPEYLLWAIRRNQITTVHFVPSMLQAFVEHDDVAACTSVEYLLCGGEGLPAPVLRRLQERLGRTAVYNRYGSTEAAVAATAWRCPKGATESIIPIGRPIWNMSIYIRQGDGHPAPIGTAGEIYIGGVGVSRGYLNGARLTAERFEPDPFGGAGGRLYRTGDLGRWLKDGNIEFLGRNDFQVKIRGFRIELGEIEARLSEQEGVREAVVLAREDTPGDKRLVAYYTAGDAGTEAEQLRTHLSGKLPEYMVPAAYVRLESLPLTPNGKLDRRALPAPEADAFAVRGYAAPQTETEQVLAGIFAELLKRERVGRQDNFFELGGHSLLVVRVIMRLQQELGVDVSTRDLFERPVLADLAQKLESASSSRLPPIRRAERSQAIPLSFAQQRLWFLAQMEGVSEVYHISLGVRLEGKLEGAALRRALDRIVARHEVLRTTFSFVEKEAVQRIHSGSGFPLLEHDLRGHTDQPDELAGLIDREARTAFDLETGPLIRGRLIRLAEDEHALLITLHHIVSDGWSMGVLMKELSALYAAFVRGGTDPLPELGVQYADYAVWQRQWVRGELLGQQAEYWRKNLQGAPELLELPVDHARPARQEYAGAKVRLVLDKELTAGLKELSRRHGATLYVTLLAGWAALLSRLSGQRDVVVGTPVANRNRHEIENLIGFFVNTLALRVDLSGSPTVGELLKRTKRQALESQQNQDIPFEQVVEIVQPVRSMAHGPLFQAMFVWASADEGRIALPGLEARPLQSAAHTLAKFDLTLSLQDVGERIVGGLEYASSLFERSTMERYVGYFRKLLAGMAADDREEMENLPLLPEAERRQVLYEWNDTAAEYPRGRCIHELFEEQVEKTPDAVAVVHDEAVLSYGELNRRANQLAHYLRNLGVKPDQRVAICVERSPEMIVSVLAVLKAGGAYVPLDPAYPEERLRYMLKDSRPVAVLTQARLKAFFTEITAVVDLADPAVVATSPRTNPECRGLTTDNLAYVIYTSGSTGMPKGVAISHLALSNYVAWASSSYGRDTGVGAPVNTPLSFDATVTSIYLPLLAGQTVILIPVKNQIEALAGLLTSGTDLTLVKLTPAHLQAVCQIPGFDAAAVRSSRLVVGGEELPESIVRLWKDENASVRIVNEYGPTEATVGCCTYEIRLGSRPAGNAPIGKPIANMQMYVLDSRRHPAPIGTAGEIYIGGVGVSRGYLNGARLTAERFEPDPFGGAGGRLYRTGDLGRWLKDGNIEFLGRNDFQVKIRGFRIELGEIEARLSEQEGVREAVVLAREDTPGDKRLVAYYTAGDAGTEAEQLRTHLSGKLPEYMVPAAYVRLESLPLTPNGKLDRRALPAPEADAFAVRGYAAPQTETEQVLAGIFAELLKRERVGRQDNFFELGGHSLLVVRVIMRLQQELGVDVSTRDLFERPVLADLAQKLESASSSRLPPIRRAERSQAIPLSFAQQRLWFLAQMEGVSEVYHISLGVRLEGKLEGAALRRALDRIVARHEVLRTTFSFVEKEAVQRIHSGSGFPLLEHDLRGHTDQPDELAGLIDREARTAFDLETGPLIRGRLIRLAEDEHALLITLHHIVSDGWSMGVLMKELSALYAAFVRGGTDPLPELGVQYADYAVWQRQWVRGELLGQQAEYWRKNLQGAPELLELPVDHARPARQEYAGAKVRLVLDKELTAGLKELSRRHGATLYVTLLAGWAALLSRLSGQRDVVVGTPVANRNRHEIENLIGFFVNTLALRVDLSGSPTVGELLKRTKRQALESQQNQDIPFEQVVEIVQPVRSMAHGPLFQAMFVWASADEGRIALPGLEARPLQSAAHTLAKFDLTLSLQDVGERIVGGLEYASSLFERSTMERYVGYFRKLLAGMAADDREEMENLPLLPEAERRQVLYEWNDTAAEYPRGRCIHELFEEQVEKTPDAVAVVHDEAVLSYGELNRRANQLAHYLRNLGVKPDQRVAICVERSPEMIVSVLAVLKAGGAYVPLDPAYPEERLRYMLKDSRPVAVLTQARQTPRLEGMSDGVPVLDLTDAAHWNQEHEGNPEDTGVSAEHLAYVIYTSGSTGQPKGVMVEHRNVVHSTQARQRQYPEQPLGYLLLSSYSFDSSVAGLFWTLARGGSLYVPGEGWHRDLAALTRHVGQHSLTHVLCLPSLYQVLVEEQAWRDRLQSLRVVMVAGENCPAKVMRWHDEVAPHASLYNEYGPTEATVWSTVYRHVRGRWAGTMPIGRPIANTQIYILDAQAAPVPVGVRGEIYIGGAGVARGYLNRPKLTAERFLKNPFEEKGRIYRTGDLGRWQADGTIEFLGRNDSQVKIRGFRIELTEVEARLSEYEGVREAVVLARKDTLGDKRLVAYYTASDAGTGAEQLRAHLSCKLPEYMVPAAYVRLESLPLTPNGKLDRKALPTPEANAFAVRAYEAPRTETEEMLAGIFAELLDLERVGREDNFFELGGHSLLAIRLVVEIRRRCGYDLPLAMVFTGATVREMAAGILGRDHPSTGRAVHLVPLQPDGALPPLFCVHPAGREIHIYRDLVRNLGLNQPVFGLRDPGEDLGRPIAQIAAEHVDAIRAVQPEGPYYLLGWSFGGIVAWEMAAHLERQQQSVAFLGVMDQFYPQAWMDLPEQESAATIIGLAYDLADQAGQAFSFTPKQIDGTTLTDQLRCTAEALASQRITPNGLDANAALRHGYETIRARMRSREGYTPASFSGMITLFKAVANRHSDEARNGWIRCLSEEERRTYCWCRRGLQRLEIHEIPGTHASMGVEPNVRVLAECLRESLTVARERVTPRSSSSVESVGEALVLFAATAGDS